MTTECSRIADQLRRAFAGDAWHGPSLRELLNGVDAAAACARPFAAAHNIWELALHIDVWSAAALGAVHGTPMPRLYGTEKDWSVIVEGTPDEWSRATAHMQRTASDLASAIETLDDARLRDIVPGRDYDFYYLFHGIVQHSLYHAGQIAILKGIHGPG